MATFKNPANTNRAKSIFASGVLGYDYYEFDFAQSYSVGAGADESLIIIGYVPADCVLVPHLCRISIPILDSNGAPTGDYRIGTLANDDALKGAAAAETAVVLTGEDLIATEGPIGSKTEDTAIVLRVEAVIATLAVTGKIVAELVYRAWDSAIDE